VVGICRRGWTISNLNGWMITPESLDDIIGTRRMPGCLASA
jgi:hypothetical protein